MRIAAALLALATVAAAPPPADWRPIGTEGDMTFLVDLANIDSEGPFRIVQLRGINRKAATDGFMEGAVDCVAKSFEARSFVVVKGGKTIRSETFEPGKRPSHALNDAGAREMIKLVCPQ